METPRLLFTFAALTLVFYTTYLASHSPYAERRHAHFQSTSPAQTTLTIHPTISVSKSSAQTCVSLPLCRNRASLVSAIATGKGCTFKWFTATEICMILERFGAVVFAGDGMTGGVYKGLEILLSSTTQETSESGRVGFGVGECACAEDLFSHACLSQIFQDFETSVKRDEQKGQKVLQPLSTRTPTTHIPFLTHPSSTEQTDAFKSLTYNHPHPWQPSPLILSFSSPPPPNTITRMEPPSTFLTTTLLTEWRTLALNAQRNIPLLYLGPSAASSRTGAELDRIKIFENEITGIAKERGFEVLSLYNLTLGITAAAGGKIGDREWERRVAMVEAMIVVNWLSKLETS